ncbi:hypothetical protein [Hydrogenovibrio kuenenii]
MLFLFTLVLHSPRSFCGVFCPNESN